MITNIGTLRHRSKEFSLKFSYRKVKALSISSFTTVNDRILITSIGFIVFEDRARTRYLRGLCGQKYRRKGFVGQEKD